MPSDLELTREELDSMQGTVMVEFGSASCPICQGFAPERDELLTEFPEVQHYAIEDGRGKPLGRSFRVKLWPTFVLMRDGEVVDRLVRPVAEELRLSLESLVGEE